MAVKKEVKESEYVKWFSELSKDDVGLVGGKGANLAEMSKINLPVPPGFVVTSKAYSYFLSSTGLDKQIYAKLKELNEEDTERLEETAQAIRELIEEKELPDDLRSEILENYEDLNVPLEGAKGTALEILKKSRDDVFVAVRSSATAEDSSAASFAGQQETFLNVKGKSNLIEHVKKCFSSLFTPRSVYYRIKKGFVHEKVLNAVVVQKMVNSEKAGVIFTKNPVNQEDEVVVEAVFGLGEGVVGGKIKPDNYIVSKELEIKNKKIAEKKIAITRNSAGENETVKLTDNMSKRQVLDNYEIKKLAEYALQIEKHYNAPQDIEFAIESKQIYIVQTRPVTTLEKKEGGEIKGEVLLKGLAASPGIASGKVKIIHNLDELEKIQKGDILVTKMTNPDMVVAMQKAEAIVTDEGGLTSHAAIVSREMGIPAVVGTDEATTKLEEGQIISVDGFTGKIIAGEQEEVEAEIEKVEQAKQTKTKLKVIVDLPDFAERASKTGLRDIGLVRLEGIIAKMKKHPLWYYKNNQLDKYSEIIFDGLQKIMKYFDTAWVRTSDLRTDEFSQLESAPEKEDNPMLGNHGLRFSLKYPEILKAELKAINKISKKTCIMFPQVISMQEIREARKIYDEICDKETNEFGVMIETPASVQIIDDINKEVDFISIGSNDLTQYTLAIDRNDEDVQELYDEMHPAVLSQISKVIKSCRENNTESSICGQAGSKREMVKFLVEQGIDSISVNADKAREISELVAEVEETTKDENINAEQQLQHLPSEEISKSEDELVEEQEIEKSEDLKTQDVEQDYMAKQEEKEEQEETQEDVEPSEEAKENEGELEETEEELTEKVEEEKQETEMHVESTNGQNQHAEQKSEPQSEENKKVKDKSTDEKEEQREEFPDTEIGFDVFSAVGDKLEEAEETVEDIGKKVSEDVEESEKSEKKKEKKDDLEVPKPSEEKKGEKKEREKEESAEDILDIF